MATTISSDVIQKIGKVLLEHSLTEGDDYHWYGDIFITSEDARLDYDTIKDIVTSENPIGRFYEIHNICLYPDYVDNEMNYLKRTVKNALGDDFNDEVEYWLEDHINLSVPIEDYLNNNFVKANIGVNTGDWNYDYTLNTNLALGDFGDAYGDNLGEEAGLLWLVRQQGYKDKDLLKAIAEGDFQESKLLESTANELANITSNINQLEFFVKLTLAEYIDLIEEPCDYVISQDTRCGLVDHANGAGSLLEIKLEKDVVIPKDMLVVEMDGARGYGAEEIYGSYDIWG